MTSPDQLIASRVQLHYAIQCIAATGMALREAQPDGSQMTLDWNSDKELFVGGILPADRAIQLALEPIHLTSLILDETQSAIVTFSLRDQTLNTALDWHKQELSKLGVAVDAIQFLGYPPDFPDHPLAHGATFVAGESTERHAIANYFAQTRPLLQTIVSDEVGASSVHIWPHHFDMATLITLAGSGEEATTIGVGFSPGDEGYSQPYWYVTPWPYPDAAKLPTLSGGNWHTESWIGAILLAETVGEITSDRASEIITTFYREAINTCHTLLKP